MKIIDLENFFEKDLKIGAVVSTSEYYEEERYYTPHPIKGKIIKTFATDDFKEYFIKLQPHGFKRDHFKIIIFNGKTVFWQ